MEKLIQYATKASYYDGPFDSVVGWSAAGMGYIVKSENGKIIVIDGGHDEDGLPLYEIIKSLSDEEIPTVEAWIITHPHGDHYGALREICKTDDLKNNIRIKSMIYHFPEGFVDAKGKGISGAINSLEKILKVTGAEHIIPTVDEHMEIDGIKLHFLYTPTDLTILDNPNQLSLIFTVEGKNKKVMFTGDAYKRNMQIVTWRYPKSLKCDILQLPHHGLCDTGDMDFYKRVDAETVLIPISVAGDRTMRSDLYGDAPLANRNAEENARNVYKAFEGTVEIEL